MCIIHTVPYHTKPYLTIPYVYMYTNIKIACVRPLRHITCRLHINVYYTNHTIPYHTIPYQIVHTHMSISNLIIYYDCLYVLYFSCYIFAITTCLDIIGIYFTNDWNFFVIYSFELDIEVKFFRAFSMYGSQPAAFPFASRLITLWHKTDVWSWASPSAVIRVWV